MQDPQITTTTFPTAFPSRGFAALASRQAWTPQTPRIRAILDGLRGRPTFEQPEVMTTAEMAECGCPEWCDRDHDND